MCVSMFMWVYRNPSSKCNSYCFCASCNVASQRVSRYSEQCHSLYSNLTGHVHVCLPHVLDHLHLA